MIRKRWQLLMTCVLFLYGSPASLAQTNTINLKDALQTTGTIILFRHALAPGFGDPTNFDVDDCKTQRNLDEQGRAQSKALGDRFKALGYSSDRVYSSPWCRCLDTARLMAIGPVEPFNGLGSFFEGHVDRGQTLALLNDKLSDIAELKRQPVVMVTHQVVISAVTGLGTSSGEGILYDPAEDKAYRITIGNND